MNDEQKSQAEVLLNNINEMFGSVDNVVIVTVISSIIVHAQTHNCFSVADVGRTVTMALMNMAEEANAQEG